MTTANAADAEGEQMYWAKAWGVVLESQEPGWNRPNSQEGALQCIFFGGKKFLPFLISCLLFAIPATLSVVLTQLFVVFAINSFLCAKKGVFS